MKTWKGRVVVALGGNALGDTLPEQMDAVKLTAKTIVDLIAEGWQVIVSHGNGPQVGLINNAMAALSRENPRHPNTPLSVCVAMSQAYIGYDLQNAIREELNRREETKANPVSVATVITQVEVDPYDEAFLSSDKPIGHYMTREQAAFAAQQYGYQMREYGDKGWRRVVPSPRPQRIVEVDTIRTLADAGQMVIACGGGGIPVVRQKEGHLQGTAAVIDKDFCAALLAEELQADALLILTNVEKVALNYGKPEQKWLDQLDPNQIRSYAGQGQFAAGSMLPKVLAAMEFVEDGEDRVAIITQLEKASDALNGRTGTRIVGHS